MTNIRSDCIQISIDWCAKTIVQLPRKSFACSSVIDICHNSKLRKKEKKYECLQVNICLVSLHSLLPQILSSVQLVQIGSTDGWECNIHRREFVKQIRAGFWVRMSNNRLLKKIGGIYPFLGVSFEKQYNSMSLDKYLQEMPQAPQEGWQFFLILQKD